MKVKLESFLPGGVFEELWYQSSLSLSPEKNSMRGKGMDKRLEQDACEAYKWVGERMPHPENLVASVL